MDGRSTCVQVRRRRPARHCRAMIDASEARARSEIALERIRARIITMSARIATISVGRITMSVRIKSGVRTPRDRARVARLPVAQSRVRGWTRPTPAPASVAQRRPLPLTAAHQRRPRSRRCAATLCAAQRRTCMNRSRSSSAILTRSSSDPASAGARSSELSAT